MSSWLRISRFFLYVQVMFPWMSGGFMMFTFERPGWNIWHTTHVCSLLCVCRRRLSRLMFGPCAQGKDVKKQDGVWFTFSEHSSFFLIPSNSIFSFSSYPSSSFASIYLFLLLCPCFSSSSFFSYLLPPHFCFLLLLLFFFRFHVFAFPQHYFSTCNHSEVRALLQAIFA